MDNVESLISSFEKEIKIQHAAQLEGDYRRNNRSVKRSFKIFNKLRKTGMVENLLPLLKSEFPEIRVNAAVMCLPIAEELCLNTLIEVRDGDYQILCIGAEYAIRNWRNDEYYLWDD